jgi:UDP-N-acetylglucosamine--N-acetylmuramyl-(pentapeptide) pyrophosphoryl-undecaprenol N-acetylglucosamine transferase
MSTAHYVFAGGGTGGHLFPGLAVANALRRSDSTARITFFTTQRQLDRELVGPTGFEQVEQPVRPFTLHPLRLPRFWWYWRRSVSDAQAYLRQHRPRAVLGLGGYAAGPPVVAARSLGIRTAILNPDAIPGRANRHLSRYADLVAMQWDVSRTHFPLGTRCETLGCPIRAEFATADGAAGRRQFGLLADRPVLLVTGASQGAHTVNQVLLRVWPAFHAAHPEWQLLHLTGPADEAAVRAAYAAAGTPTQVVSFTHEMWLALAAADAVVSRAGASTLAELAALGKPSILLPYPYHRDRHQHANAQVLVDAGAAVVLEDYLWPEKNEPALREALAGLADQNVRRTMAAAAARLGRPMAADAVASWLRGATPSPAASN